MTLKDLLRLLRRRWLTAVVVAVAVFAGVWAFSAVTERPQFRARARVLMSTPPVLVTASQGTQWISINQMEPKTWYSIVASRHIRENAERALKAKATYPVQSGWFSQVSAVPEAGSQLVWIEAVAPTPTFAADVANAVAEQIELYSRQIANEHLIKARRDTQDRIDRENKTQEEQEAAARKIREQARSQFGSENLELDVKKLEEEIQAHDSRRRDLERKTATNRLRLERIREDRSVAEHLRREGAPRLGSASLESRIQDSPAVRALGERLETLHRDLLLALRKYTEEHPQVKALRSDIRHTEIEHTRSQILALGRDIDKEELDKRADNELLAIELRVLAPEVKDLRERLAQLSPLLETVRIHNRAIQDSRTRETTTSTLLAQLVASPEMAYVQRLPGELAQPQEAVPVEMRLRKSLPIAFMAAIILGISFAFLMEFLDTSIRNDYDVRRHLDYPVLAVIPRVAAADVLTLRAGRANILSEIYDTLATVLLSGPTDRASRIFLVTSTNPQEGKTAVSINLAVALARQGKRTLLVDGDMRVPSIHGALAIPNNAGLSDLLGGQVTMATENLLQEIEVPNLKVLTCGASPENPYELLDTARVGPVAAQLREQFDAVVIDTPPVLRTGDALKISSVVDATLFVIEAGKTDQRQATWAKRLLTNVGAKVAGVVLNRAVAESEEYYYYYGTGGYSRKEARTN